MPKPILFLSKLFNSLTELPLISLFPQTPPLSSPSLLPSPGSNNFFEYGHRLMVERWGKLKEVVGSGKIFTLPEYPTEYCLFSGKFNEAHPSNVHSKFRV